MVESSARPVVGSIIVAYELVMLVRCFVVRMRTGIVKVR